MYKESSLSGVNVVLVLAYGSLVFVLLFIFLKRQIMRFLMASHGIPDMPVGHNAPKELREKIESLLFKEYYRRREPRLLSNDDVRLQHRGLNSCNYLYRMQVLDIIKDADIVRSTDLSCSHSTRTGSCYRNWLLVQRNSPTQIQSSLIDRLLEGYHNARYGTGVFGEAEFLKYKEDLAELAASIKVHFSTLRTEQRQKPQ
ncbi:hypothetical protein Baya_1270 [Bagarius yarrelli]|uniref:Uncharacterized protein n=1 Tax=Bagarius yarrelli TaxID=175774 RepID=A0A556TKM9_BAGYA|nr:hypothetical protein Baya_1270 [Bagarius yarrelli]